MIIDKDGNVHENFMEFAKELEKAMKSGTDVANIEEDLHRAYYAVSKSSLDNAKLGVDTRHVFGRPGLTEAERAQMLKSNPDWLSDRVRTYFMKPSLPMLDAATQVKFWTEISKFPAPTDTIVISNTDASYLHTFWMEKTLKSVIGGVPADIIFAKTLPLTNFEIQITYETGVASVRCIFFDKWKLAVDAVMSEDCADEIAAIGVFIVKPYADTKMVFYCPIMVQQEFDFLLFLGGGWHVYEKDASLKTPPIISHGMAILEESMHWVPALWYGIELSLLNPLTSNVYSNPETYEYEVMRAEGTGARKSKGGKGGSSSGKPGKRKVTNIRRHVIQTNAFESAMTRIMPRDDGSGKSFTRKTMAWWVIGHWRRYKSGKKIFVSGYWKGPLRQVKQNLDDGRDRKIPISV